MLLSGIPERPFPKVSRCDQGLGHELTGVNFQAKDPAWGTVTSQPHHTSNPLIFRVVQNKKTRSSGHPAVVILQLELLLRYVCPLFGV
jgi:hypothetical protein